MTNNERFVKHAQRHNIAESEEILDRRLEIIPVLSRKVLKTRWGLNGGNYCNTFDALEEKLGLMNSRDLYDKSMRDLACAVYAEIIADRNKIGDWNVTVGLGRLACAVLYTKDVDTVCGEKLFEALDTLAPHEKNILFLRFGIDGKGTKTLEEVGDIFELPRERIRQIENKSIRKLRHPRRVKIFYIPNIIEDEEKEAEVGTTTKTEGTCITKETSINDADFSVRTFNCLKRAGINTIEDIMNNPQAVVSARNFSKSSAKEILKIFETGEITDTECTEAKKVLKEFIQ